MKERDRLIEEKIKNHDEFKFRLQTLTAKLYGVWAAKEIDFNDAETEAYINQVIEAGLEEPGFDDVVRKVHKDLTDAGVDKTLEQMYEQLDEVMTQARNTITIDEEEQ